MTLEKECIECGLEYRIYIDETYDVTLNYCPCCGYENRWEVDLDNDLDV